jgi:hypothetical protein
LQKVAPIASHPPYFAADQNGLGVAVFVPDRRPRLVRDGVDVRRQHVRRGRKRRGGGIAISHA